MTSKPVAQLLVDLGVTRRHSRLHAPTTTPSRREDFETLKYAAQVRAQRAVTLDAACAANPARFRHQRPKSHKLPTVAWINEPAREALIHNE